MVNVAEWENKIKGGSKGVNIADDNCNLEEFVAKVIQLNLHLQEWLLTLIAQDKMEITLWISLVYMEAWSTINQYHKNKNKF